MNSAKDAIIAQQKMIDKAKSALLEYIIPDGIPCEVAMENLIYIFDCPEQRKADELVNYALAELP